MRQNKKQLQDLVKGQYGRKIAYTYVDKITPDNILTVIGKTIGIFYRNRQICEYLWNYYKGDQPIRYRNKKVRPDIVNTVVENHAYEIVQFKNGQTYGEPIQYISRKDDKKVNNAVDMLNDYMVDAEKQSKDIQMGEWQSAVGTSFKAVQQRKDEIPFRIVIPTPLNTYIVYSQNTEEPMLSVQDLKDGNGEKYLLCFSKNMQFVIKNSKVIDYGLHIYKDIPIVEYPNNNERLSDIELVIDLLDAINGMQSNRMDAVEQFVQSWVKFVNCDISTESFQSMREQGALVVNSNNNDNKADVDIMTQELNQTESQVAKDDLWNNALSISAIPNKQGNNTGGDTQGAVELRNGWDFSKTRAKLKDALVKTSEKRFAKLVLNILDLADNGLNISTRDFDVKINHSPTDNLIIKCQALDYLLKNGIHPLIAIKTVGLWGDAEKTYILSQKYIDKMMYSVKDAEIEQKKAEQLNKQFNNNINQ